MKKILRITLLFICVNTIASSIYAQELDWAISMGASQYDEGHSIAIDASGNVYTTGLFLGTVDFDSGPGTFNLSSINSGPDNFVSKLDASGNLVWVKQIGGAGLESGQEIVVDISGNVYITGILAGSADFDPGVGTFNLTSAGTGYDIFVCKLDASGNFVWAKLMGGTTYDESLSIAVDATGNVYTTGYFTGTADFDPGAGTYNLLSWGMKDIFISKLDASGNFVWAKSMGGSDYDGGDGIAVDGSGNVYITGGFQVGVDFDPGPGACIFNALGSGDAFVCKFDASGNFVWAKQLGRTSNDAAYAFSICTDNSGNVYTCGYFAGTVDFDPGAGTANLTSVGFNDIFISKLDASGNFIWAKRMGGGAYETPYDIAVDGLGNVYTTGCFSSTADFDPGPGAFNLTAGLDEIFVSKLDASGNFAWAKQMGGSGHDQGFSIAVDGIGSVHVIGNFSGTGDFDPESSTVNLVSAGQYDIFILKLNSCTSVNHTENITACAPYTWRDGNTYTTSQSGVPYTSSGAVIGGCDSVYVMNLTILNASTGIDVINTCDPYTWIDGITYTTSNNTATYLLTNMAGCDSIVTLNLTINSNTGTAILTECNSYTWIDGVTYTTSNNTATYVLTNAAGCDSVVTLNLTINNSPTVTATDNGSGTLTASTANSYQWINCATNTALPGETNATFTPLANGTYAVIGYSAGLCSDTSDCVVINYLGIEEAEDITWNIMPNPASSYVTIRFNVLSAELIIRDVQGKPVATKTIHSGEIISLEEYSTGVYFFELITAEGKTVKRVLKM